MLAYGEQIYQSSGNMGSFRRMRLRALSGKTTLETNEAFVSADSSTVGDFVLRTSMGRVYFGKFGALDVYQVRKHGVCVLWCMHCNSL